MPSQQHLFKRRYFEPDVTVCRYCNGVLDENTGVVDHIIPKSAGGNSRKENLCFACRTCNNMKSALSLDDFKSHITKLYKELCNG
jgi:5-methylcytosine-specific restriction endonuclease McrA